MQIIFFFENQRFLSSIYPAKNAQREGTASVFNHTSHQLDYCIKKHSRIHHHLNQQYYYNWTSGCDLAVGLKNPATK